MRAFTYALEKSHDELIAILACVHENAYLNDLTHEINYRLGTYLFWLLSTWERIEKNTQFQICAADMEYMRALKHAYNSIKHEETLVEPISTAKKGGFTFPIVFPLIIPMSKFVWVKLHDTGKFQNQLKKYQQTLVNEQ